jgi:hypothetical protein
MTRGHGGVLWSYSGGLGASMNVEINTYLGFLSLNEGEPRVGSAGLGICPRHFEY